MWRYQKPTCRQPAQSCRQAHAFQNSRFLDCVDLSKGPFLLSTGTHRARKPELCLLLAVDSPFLAVDRMDMNAQERLVAAMEMLCQDIELYAQAQREAHPQIKEEVLNLTAGAFMAGNPCASLEIMSQVMINLDNLKLGQDLLFHQVEGHWEALTDAARELYHGARVEQQAPPMETILFDLIMDGGDANWKKMESSMHDLTRVMKVVAKNNSHNGTSLYKDFRSLDPPRFAGSTDPDEAENWLKAIERIFRMIKCTEEEKVCLTTFQLDRDARAWWETVEATLEDSNQVIQLGMTFKGLSAEWTH
ncbi:hypothetical protein Taro_006275 [Colocasia esculenta]|uniref:Retrotransposon gag domain-containing protein n=1 Tax=Colocasia esculenta TaxID=4460 RepID=A0A843TN87_COLES|nr:hypothetical protein [Colocasia esculenta]